MTLVGNILHQLKERLARPVFLQELLFIRKGREQSDRPAKGNLYGLDLKIILLISLHLPMLHFLTVGQSAIKQSP